MLLSNFQNIVQLEIKIHLKSFHTSAGLMQDCISQTSHSLHSNPRTSARHCHHKRKKLKDNVTKKDTVILTKMWMSMRYSKVMLELLLAVYHYYRCVCVWGGGAFWDKSCRFLRTCKLARKVGQGHDCSANSVWFLDSYWLVNNHFNTLSIININHWSWSLPRVINFNFLFQSLTRDCLDESWLNNCF